MRQNKYRDIRYVIQASAVSLAVIPAALYFLNRPMRANSADGLIEQTIIRQTFIKWNWKSRPEEPPSLAIAQQHWSQLRNSILQTSVDSKTADSILRVARAEGSSYWPVTAQPGFVKDKSVWVIQRAGWRNCSDFCGMGKQWQELAYNIVVIEEHSPHKVLARKSESPCTSA